MRILVQRVKEAKVLVNGQIIGQIGKGILVFLGIARGDNITQAEWLVKKVCSLRIFADKNSEFNLSLKEIGGEILVVSQFTLYGDCRKGRRPSFDQAAPPPEALLLYESFIKLIKQQGIKVATGKFGALMQVHLINDGPVTLILER
ncbi:D-tyrosyl-tRNA(Tyr) deacylase [Candidatus Desulfofervidus auxilii]|uniref:D-aminoacyl-tRNA deacylase n=1 Tax=Desulfofervidus auxilii TaxID=1621989 RepID=A0A7U4QLI5_DESA2|nr:D-aminoacyl-tRNA deacylase [Candidatus Desulfofervidus auxilii]AMM41565.1 D-tyrosyl-tRNA(Tyr) deacylase [Candidatus Desulfofervidus auxilii]